MLESVDVSATLQEDVDVATLLVRAKDMREGNPFAGVFRNIRIFVREQDNRIHGNYTPGSMYACPICNPDVETGERYDKSN
jgi:hypothetical protein